MAITVFGATHSTQTQRVLLLLEELGLEYELKPVELIKGEHHVRGRLSNYWIKLTIPPSLLMS